MAKIITYMREAPDLASIESQKAAFRRAGAPPESLDEERGSAYLDREPKKRATRTKSGLPQRDLILRSLRQGEGDAVWVASLRVVGVSRADAITAMKAWAARGASVRIIAEDLELQPGGGPDWLEAADRLEAQAARDRTAPARAARAQRAKLTSEEQKAAWALAAEMWPKVEVHTTEEIEKATGISRSTLYRAARSGLLPRRQGQAFGARDMLKPRRGKR